VASSHWEVLGWCVDDDDGDGGGGRGGGAESLDGDAVQADGVMPNGAGRSLAKVAGLSTEMAQRIWGGMRESGDASLGKLAPDLVELRRYAARRYWMLPGCGATVFDGREHFLFKRS